MVKEHLWLHELVRIINGVTFFLRKQTGMREMMFASLEALGIIDWAGEHVTNPGFHECRSHLYLSESCVFVVTSARDS